MYQRPARMDLKLQQGKNRVCQLLFGVIFMKIRRSVCFGRLVIKIIFTLHDACRVSRTQDFFQFQFHFIRIVNVIMGQPGKIVSGHSFYTGIQCAGSSAVFFFQISDPVPIGQGDPFGLPSVGRAVIDNKHFYIGVSLREGAVNGLFQIITSIIYRDHN